uniref:Uncharacterized protein n=1 Tax=Anguilla anguilla TaxID=7936 RepID=A0A0E9XIH1_ANGAN
MFIYLPCYTQREENKVKPYHKLSRCTSRHTLT